MHLAQLNIGRFRYPTDDPRMAGFMDNLERVNAIADRSEGFVWRLQDESGNATNLRIGDDYAVNLSVWENVEALEQFVFKTIHVQFYKKREAWFDAMETPHMVMWWIEEGHVPTLDEALDRLEHLQADGPSEYAFGWKSLPQVQMWKQARCA